MHTRLGTVRTEHVVPKQRKLMGSSAQNSSGVHWCRRRVRFNEVPEKVPKVPARSGSTGFRKPSQVQQGSGEGSGEGSGGGRGGFGAEPGQVQQGSGEGSGEGLWGFGAEPGQVQQGSGEGSGEGSGKGSRKLWCKAKSGLTGCGEGCRSQARSGSFSSRKPSWGFSSAWLRSTLQKDL